MTRQRQRQTPNTRAHQAQSARVRGRVAGRVAGRGTDPRTYPRTDPKGNLYARASHWLVRAAVKWACKGLGRVLRGLW